MSGLTSFFRVAAVIVVLAVSVAIFFTICLVLLPSRYWRIRATNVFGHLASRACVWISGSTVTPGAVEAVREHFPCIYISNHTSMIDIFLGSWLSASGTVGIAKKQVVWYPFFGQLYAISGHILVDRDNRANAVAALANAAAILKKYHAGLWIWPEGTRSRDGRLQPFKKGFAHMALATRLPIVPVVVTGAHRCIRKNSLVVHPTDIGVKVLPPIPTDDWTLEDLDKHIAKVYAIFDAALPDDQKAPALVEGPRATGT